MSHGQIEKVTKEGRTFTYMQLVVGFRPHKKKLNRIRMTAGGNIKFKFLSKSDYIAKSSVNRTLKQYTTYTAVFSVAERGCQTAKQPVFSRVVVRAFDRKSVSG